MVHSTPTGKINNDNIEILESQIRECFGRVVWTHKIHEKCSDIYAEQLRNLKLAEIVLSSLTTTSLLVSIFGNQKLGAIIGAILSTVVLCLTIYTKDYDLGKLSKNHADTANQLWNIRESYISLIADIKTGSLTVDQIRQKRDELQKLLSLIYEYAPRTDGKGYTLASKALNKNGLVNQGEEMTFSDNEIDRFLPNNLRKNKI